MLKPLKIKKYLTVLRSRKSYKRIFVYHIIFYNYTSFKSIVPCDSLKTEFTEIEYYLKLDFG